LTPTAVLEVRIYETARDLHRGVTSPRKIVSELVRSDVKPEQMIYRGTDSAWKKPDLAPGGYRLTALAVIEQGQEVRLPNRDSEHFRLRAGEFVTATIVIKKAPIGAILGVSAGVAALIIGLSVLALAGALASFDREPVLEEASSSVREKPSLPVGRPLSAIVGP
jgi:hypothetical protein